MFASTNMGVFCVLVLISLIQHVLCHVNVLDFGAVGNGVSDDTEYFMNAWKATCSGSGPSTFQIPEGKTFLLRPISFVGPCSAPVNVEIMGDLTAPKAVWNPSALKQFSWITFHQVDGITFSGSGQIDGNGAVWWTCNSNESADLTKKKRKCGQRPFAFAVSHCTNVRLVGLSFKNSPGMHIAIYDSSSVSVSGITVTAPQSSPNTDGIHIERSQQVTVTDSTIATGDDCISIGTGTSDLNITQITCGPGHGISIGSLGNHEEEATVERVRVSNCNFFNTANAARIKTWQGGSGYVKDITFEHIKATSVQYAIHIDQYYPSSKYENRSSAVQISGVQFIDIQGTATETAAINLACSKFVACTDITLQDINIQSADPEKQVKSYCLNVHGSASGVSPDVTCLQS